MLILNQKPISYNPTQVSNGLFWLDGSVMAAGAITSVSDLFGTGATASQATIAKKPIVATSQQNGLNAIQFVSANSQNLILSSGVLPFAAGNNTVIAVSRITSETGVRKNILGGDVTNTFNQVLRYSSIAGRLECQNGASAGPVITGLTNTNTQIIYSSVSSSTIAIANTRSKQTTNTNATSQILTNCYIGARTGNLEFFDGVLCELLIYGKSLTYAERFGLLTYLSNKWNVAV